MQNATPQNCTRIPLSCLACQLLTRCNSVARYIRHATCSHKPGHSQLTQQSLLLLLLLCVVLLSLLLVFVVADCYCCYWLVDTVVVGVVVFAVVVCRYAFLEIINTNGVSVTVAV
jgi:hypothetical protein